MNITIRRGITAVLVGQFFLAALAAPVVNAQATASGGMGVSSAPAIIASPIPPPTPIPIPPPGESGFIQFNNLTIESVSGTSVPAEILASNPVFYPMLGAANAPNVPTASAGVSSGATCLSFGAQGSGAGMAVACPTPSVVPSTAPTTQMPPYPAYRIEVDASTRLLLLDRTVATLSSFTPGDQINVFGYYNTDGSIQAYLIRDLSKPVQDEFLQLNNVQLVSISTTTNPATLVVTQSQGYPCYGFGSSGAVKQSIVCPMGASAAPGAAAIPALQNISVPAALAPDWAMLKKYVVNVDAQTVILDSNRTALSLADLQIGDSLNVYGDTTDNGQTISADIVRDLSIPAAPSAYNGKVTQVNADGSFVVQANDGQTITVQNPIQVGAMVQLTGLLNRLTNVLSQVTNISVQ